MEFLNRVKDSISLDLKFKEINAFLFGHRKVCSCRVSYVDYFCLKNECGSCCYNHDHHDCKKELFKKITSNSLPEIEQISNYGGIIYPFKYRCSHINCDDPVLSSCYSIRCALHCTVLCDGFCNFSLINKYMDHQFFFVNASGYTARVMCKECDFELRFYDLMTNQIIKQLQLSNDKIKFDSRTLTHFEKIHEIANIETDFIYHDCNTYKIKMVHDI